MDRLQFLIERYIADQATIKEKNELAELVSRLDNQTITSYLKNHWENFNLRKDVFSKEESEFILQQILSNNKQNRKAVPLFKNRWLQIAATILIVLLGSSVYYDYKQSDTEKPAIANATHKNDIAPGNNKALLQLADGTEIDLYAAKNGLLASQANVNVVKLDNGQIKYNPSGKGNQPILYNTIVTPRGGQYELILPDSSKALLNSSSTIRFPVAFSGKQRRVEITGEVYFEVAKIPGKPFIVSSGEMDVLVYGTHFIVSAYADEAIVKTTLLEGSVKVSFGTNVAMLEPGQQAQLNKDGELLVEKEVNLQKESSWIHGLFVFDHSSIQEIMGKISRWYDVDIVYSGNTTKKTFSGIVNRNSNVSQVLEIMERVGIKFTIEGDKIIVNQ